MRRPRYKKRRVIDDLSFRITNDSFILTESDDEFYIITRDLPAPNLRNFHMLSNYRFADEKVFEFKNAKHKEYGDKTVIKVTFNE